jgi:hypothetical protein
MIRARLYSGLCKGSMKVGSYFKDEKSKLRAPAGCWYCGGSDRLSADHVISRLRGGSDGGENLIYACRTCNSSKGSRDLLAWMASHGRFPPLGVLRRYLKMAIAYCREQNLLAVPLADAEALKTTLPFALDLIPHDYPSADQLCWWIGNRANPI